MRSEIHDVAPGTRPGGCGSPLVTGVVNDPSAVEELVERLAVDPLVLDEVGGEPA